MQEKNDYCIIFVEKQTKEKVMRTKGPDKKQIRRCLLCRIGRTILMDYKNIYGMKKEDLASDIGAQKIIEGASNILGIEGTRKEKYALLKSLTKIKLEDETKELQQRLEVLDIDEAEDYCLINLRQIIPELRCFYNERDLLDIDIITEHKNNKHMILSCMHEDNKGKKSLFDKPYRETEGDKALKEFGKKDFKNLPDNITEPIVKELKYIFDFYYTVKEVSYEINHKRECRGKLFLETVKENENIRKAIQKESSSDLEFWERVSALSEQFQDVMIGFLNKMPIKFGCNLERVMKDKNMTAQDIAMLSSGRLKANNIQSYVQCSTPSNLDETLDILSKILLVSKSVLYLGYGRTYGNWKDLLSKESLEEFQKIDKEEFSNKSTSKKFVQENVSLIVNDAIKDNETFMNMIKDNPTLFEDKKYNVYEDGKERFKNIIDKKYAYILLETLEQIEKSK